MKLLRITADGLPLFKDKLDISAAGEAGGNTGSEEAEEDKGTKDDKKVKKSGEKPILLKHRGFKYEHNSNGQLVIDHKYSYLSLGYDQGRSNKELAVSLDNDDRITWYSANVESMESIHEHNAFAEIERTK